MPFAGTGAEVASAPCRANVASRLSTIWVCARLETTSVHHSCQAANSSTSTPSVTRNSPAQPGGTAHDHAVGTWACSGTMEPTKAGKVCSPTRAES